MSRRRRPGRRPMRSITVTVAAAVALVVATVTWSPTGIDPATAAPGDTTLWAWGTNTFGQLGLGDTTDRSTPTQGGTHWTRVSVGGGFAAAIDPDGALWTWGHNAFGQLGLGDAADRPTPSRVGTDTDWAHVTAGNNHMAAIKTDGTLWTWGHDIFGQLGLGDTDNRSTLHRTGTSIHHESAWRDRLRRVGTFRSDRATGRTDRRATGVHRLTRRGASNSTSGAH